MNVVLVTRFYPPETGGGGIAAYASYLATGLTEAGHGVRVVSAWAPGADETRVVDGVTVRRIRALTVPYRYHRLPLVGRYLRWCNDLAYARRVRAELTALYARQPFDVVEYADIDAEGLYHPARLAPAAVRLHGPHFVLRRFYQRAEMPYDTASVCRLERRQIRQAALCTSPSRWLKEAVAHELGLDPGRIALVPNLIDARVFAPGPEVDGEPLVLYVGRLENLKGAPVFADAIPAIARSAPTARFCFLGADRPTPDGGSWRDRLAARLESAGVSERVTFQGHSTRDVFLDYHRRATVCVVPSLMENCPYTLLEAMSCGKPVVTSDAYGMREIVSDGETGLLFAPGDAADLAAKVARLLASPDLAARLGQAARAEVLQRYDLRVGTAQTLAAYQLARSGW